MVRMCSEKVPDVLITQLWRRLEFVTKLTAIFKKD